MSFFVQLEGRLSLPLTLCFCGCGIALFFAFVLAVKYSKKEAYTSAFFFFAACACLCGYASNEGGGKTALLTACFSCAIFGASYPCLLVALSLQRDARRRRQERAMQAKREAFVLPDKDNEYLRDRLLTSLCKGEEGSVLTSEAFQLSYVRRTLVKLKVAALSPADRVETEKIAEEVAKYCAQTTLSVSQLRTLNERFARVLKLAAKYAV